MNSSNPLVSILINNYNYENYLKASIDSALHQTYSPIEVIVIDDGSTDSSREIIMSYKDKITPIYKENGGIPSAFNAGFAISQGEIICVLDSDDLWLPTKVKQVVKTFSDNPKAAIVYHKVQTINETGIAVGEPWPPYRIIRGDISKQVSQTGGWWPFPPSTALSYPRTYLTRVMNIPEQDYRPLGADTYLADLAPYYGEVIGIDQVLSLYRDHSSNHSKTWNQSFIDSLNYHKQRVKLLNHRLNDLDIPVTVSLTDNWPYQHLRFKSGQEKNLIYLTRLIFNNPWESKLPSKTKTALKLWCESLGIGTSRL